MDYTCDMEAHSRVVTLRIRAWARRFAVICSRHEKIISKGVETETHSLAPRVIVPIPNSRHD
jgi:hypothetical protein